MPMERQTLPLRVANGAADQASITSQTQDTITQDVHMDDDTASENSSIAYNSDLESGRGRNNADRTAWTTSRPIFLLNKHREETAGLEDYRDNYMVYDVPVLDQATHTALGPSFRLLQIEPAAPGSPIDCKLITRPIFDAPSYIALSYSWGTGLASSRIYVGKSRIPFRVSKHLHHALERLRHLKRTVTVWIDVICIDQQNLLDKSAQIEHMSHIFHEAQEVRVWLDEMDGLGTEHMNDAELFTHLFQQPTPWWTRLWVLQECAYANSCPQVMIGAHTIRLDEFVERWSLAATSIVHDDAIRRTLVRHLGYVRGILDIWQAQAEHNICRRPLIERLREAVGRCHTFSHDRFYAILSLVNEDEARQLPPDYSLPYKDVWQQACKILESSPGFDAHRDMFLLGPETGSANYLVYLEAALAHGHFDTVNAILNVTALENQHRIVGRTSTRRTATNRPANTTYEYPAPVRYALQSALLMCAKAGNVDAVRVLLRHGTSLKASGTSRTPLYSAAEGGHSDVVRLLLDAGADVDESSGNNCFAIQGALASGDAETIKLVLDAGADLDHIASDDFVKLSMAGVADAVGMVLDKGYNTAATGVMRPVLLHAANRGHTELVRKLLETKRSMPRNEALQTALDNGHAAVALLLIQAGAIPGSWGLKTAASKGMTEVVRLCIDRGFELNYHCGLYGTALSDAVVEGHLEIVRMLVLAGADVSVHGSTRGCALELAAKSGRGDILAILLDASTALTEEGDCFDNALASAQSQDRADLVELLQSRQQESWTML